MWKLTTMLTLPLLLLSGPGVCKASRPPDEAPFGNVTGTWSAQTTGQAGDMRWQLFLHEGQAGRIAGEGALADPTRSYSFPVRGVRGERVVKLDLRLEETDSKFEGSLMDAHTLVGEIILGRDTLITTFTRR